jgi:hypothetical protein
MIIGLCGAQGVGKDTVGNILVSEYGFTKITFATALKDVISILFSWPRDLLEGATEESRLWRETIDMYWSEKMSIPDFTPRKALQFVGTDLLRRHLYNDIWVNIVENKIKMLLELNPQTNIVITDCRFINEFNMIKNFSGSQIFKIVKDNDIQLTNTLLHSSEVDWQNYRFDRILYNKNTISDLENVIKNIIKDVNK